MKLVVVPQRDIDELEEARLALYKMLEDTNFAYELPYGISDKLYTITHSIYIELDENTSIDELIDIIKN